MRRWHTGGDGEAEVVFRDQARELAEKQGYRHYVVLSLVQGIESTAPIAQRWARGEIEAAMPPMPWIAVNGSVSAGELAVDHRDSRLASGREVISSAPRLRQQGRTSALLPSRESAGSVTARA